MHAEHGRMNAGSWKSWKIKAQQFDWDPAQTSPAVTAEQSFLLSPSSISKPRGDPFL